MANNKFLSHVGIARIATIVLGVIVLGVGLHSHFQSYWTGYKVLGHTIRPHEQCKLNKNPKVKCPSISMERYYIAIIIICFILSVVGLVASFWIDFSTQPYKLVDVIYHAIAAILLLIGAIVYFVSAKQIHDIYGVDKIPRTNLSFQRGEKFAAASLTIMQSLLYGFIALLSARTGFN